MGRGGSTFRRFALISMLLPPACGRPADCKSEGTRPACKHAKQTCCFGEGDRVIAQIYSSPRRGPARGALHLWRSPARFSVSLGSLDHHRSALHPHHPPLPPESPKHQPERAGAVRLPGSEASGQVFSWGRLQLLKRSCVGSAFVSSFAVVSLRRSVFLFSRWEKYQKSDWKPPLRPSHPPLHIFCRGDRLRGVGLRPRILP